MATLTRTISSVQTSGPSLLADAEGSFTLRPSSISEAYIWFSKRLSSLIASGREHHGSCNPGEALKFKFWSKETRFSPESTETFINLRETLEVYASTSLSVSYHFDVLPITTKFLLFYLCMVEMPLFKIGPLVTGSLSSRSCFVHEAIFCRSFLSRLNVTDSPQSMLLKIVAVIGGETTGLSLLGQIEALLDLGPLGQLFYLTHGLSVENLGGLVFIIDETHYAPKAHFISRKYPHVNGFSNVCSLLASVWYRIRESGYVCVSSLAWSPMKNFGTFDAPFQYVHHQPHLQGQCIVLLLRVSSRRVGEYIFCENDKACLLLMARHYICLDLCIIFNSFNVKLTVLCFMSNVILCGVALYVLSFRPNAMIILMRLFSEAIHHRMVLFHGLDENLSSLKNGFMPLSREISLVNNLTPSSLVVVFIQPRRESSYDTLPLASLYYICYDASDVLSRRSLALIAPGFMFEEAFMSILMLKSLLPQKVDLVPQLWLSSGLLELQFLIFFCRPISQARALFLTVDGTFNSICSRVLKSTVSTGTRNSHVPTVAGPMDLPTPCLFSGQVRDFQAALRRTIDLDFPRLHSCIDSNKCVKHLSLREYLGIAYALHLFSSLYEAVSFKFIVRSCISSVVFGSSFKSFIIVKVLYDLT